MPGDQHDVTLELLAALVAQLPAGQRPDLREQLALIPPLLEIHDADAAENLVLSLLQDARQRKTI